jgi:hypothetical protein
MKSYKEFSKSLKEGYDEEHDDMSIRELKIACYTSGKILEMLENGAELERWNLSKITLAADYLTSVYAFMQSNMDDEPDYDSPFDQFDGNY